MIYLIYYKKFCNSQCSPSKTTKKRNIPKTAFDPNKINVREVFLEDIAMKLDKREVGAT
jgi:hypothetical protein